MTTRTVISDTAVVTMDDELGDLARVDIVIEDGRISSIGPDLAEVDDDVIDGTGGLVIPGLVDTHIHLWQTALRGMATELWIGEYFGTVLPYRRKMRPEDMRDSTYVGAIELLDRGITTALDFCHCIPTPEHPDAALAGHREAGGRVILAYSLRNDPPGHFRGHADRREDAERFINMVQAAQDPLIRPALAMSDMEFVEIDDTIAEVELARRLDVMMTIHSNHPGQIRAMDAAGLLGPDLLPVHCNTVADDEFGRLAATGTPISSTPELELGMGHDMTAFRRALDAGTRLTLGNDTATFARPNLLEQARLAWLTQRATDATQERLEGRRGSSIRRPGIPRATPRDVLRMATIEGARALGMDDRIGSITVGKEADLVMLSTGGYGSALADPAAHVVLHAGADAIDTVMVAGRLHRRAGQRVTPDDTELERRTEVVRRHLDVVN